MAAARSRCRPRRKPGVQRLPSPSTTRKRVRSSLRVLRHLHFCSAIRAGVSWRVKVTFGDKAPAIHAVIAHGERMKIGPIDPETVGDTNEPPKLDDQIAQSWTWIPDAATWAEIQKHSVSGPATITITGYDQKNAAVSEAHTTFTTSKDRVDERYFSAMFR